MGKLLTTSQLLEMFPFLKEKNIVTLGDVVIKIRRFSFKPWLRRLVPWFRVRNSAVQEVRFIIVGGDDCDQLHEVRQALFLGESHPREGESLEEAFQNSRVKNPKYIVQIERLQGEGRRFEVVIMDYPPSD